MGHIEKFQGLLWELFQFDTADLDFGIYRIMNHRREVIKNFIERDLPKSISKELSQGALAGQAQAIKGLEEARKKVLAISDDAFDAAGNLVKYHDTKPGKEYLSALEKAKSAKGSEALESTIYNHLYTFFSRYYQDGDFISKRRYSKRERYAIPYNGEEVTFYWANRDQYYIKTGEYFTDYTWKSAEITVHFKLTSADVEQNNIKGNKRFFIPCMDKILWDESTRSLTFPCEFRPLNGQETITYGGKNQQEAIIAKAVENIPKQPLVKKAPLALAELLAERSRTADDEIITNLEYHLRQYTRRNTSDFFIHKDLRGFLRSELDFYLKNEVLNLTEMETAGEELSNSWFQMMRLIKRIGGHIIEFLGQIEHFQKILWEKRKLITETFYCITIDQIPEGFYPEIAGCNGQWAEWKLLLSIDEAKNGDGKKARRLKILKEYPTLVLDTRHFPQEFTDRLLMSFGDLDKATDGLLVHSENWQALNLLIEKYREQVKCIYIDPPYNTSENTFLYKNNYKHSSWLAMMSSLITISRQMLLESGVHEVAIDDTETHHLRAVLDSLLGQENRAATIAAEVNPAGQNLRPNSPALSHDYCHVYASNIEKMKLLFRELTKEEIESYNEKDKKGFFLWDNLRRRGGNSRPSDRPGQWFPLFIKGKKSVRVPEMEWDQQGKKWIIKEKPSTGEVEIWPIDPKGEERIWRVNPDGARKDIKSGNISVRIKADRLEVVKKSYMPEGKKPKTLWKDPKYSATTHGTKLLINILGKQAFSYPKSLYLVMDCIRYWADDLSLVLDFFGGSGTSGHAVINLNREDGGRRKFILVEMADYFDTVLLPRIKKVTFSPEWNDGKPKRMASPEEAERGPRIVKIIRLESYEDALNNINYDEHSGQQVMQFEDYLLQYMIRWETRHSETLLNVEKLVNPFSYQLHIKRDGETISRAVDLPETFTYLLGLYVRKRKVIYDDDKRRYLVYEGTTRKGRKVVVIWRNIEGWKEKDYKRDKEFVAEQQFTTGMDEVYINGDSYIPHARALEPVFKALMFAEVEA